MSIKKADGQARLNYKAKIKRITIELYPTDEDIKNHLESLREPVTSYIKRIIREKIN